MPRCGPGDNYLDRLSSASYKLQAIVSKMARIIKMEGSQKVVCYERPFLVSSRFPPPGGDSLVTCHRDGGKNRHIITTTAASFSGGTRKRDR